MLFLYKKIESFNNENSVLDKMEEQFGKFKKEQMKLIHYMQKFNSLGFNLSTSLLVQELNNQKEIQKILLKQFSKKRKY